MHREEDCHCQVLERLNAVEATLAALRAQLQASPSEPPPIVAAGSSAAAGTVAASQTQQVRSAAPAGGAPAGTVPADSMLGQRPTAEGTGSARQDGWLGGLARVFSRAAWQRPTANGSNGSHTQAGPGAACSVGHAAAKSDC